MGKGKEVIDKDGISRKVFNVSRGILDSKLMYLYTNRVPFKVATSGSFCSVQSKVFNFSCVNKSFEPKDLNFIKSVKRYVKKNNISLKFIDQYYKGKNINYIAVNTKIKEGEVFNNVCCIDLKSAYWQSAYLLGCISQEIYQEGLNRDKITRLASLGSLAKKTEHREFDGTEYKLVDLELSLETENVWFAICHNVDEVMKSCVKLLGKDFLFYWVDGIYFADTPENRAKVFDCFSSFKFESKTEGVSKVEFFKDHFFVHSQNELSFKKFSWILGFDRDKKSISPAEMVRLIKLGNDIMYPNKKS